MPLTTDTTGQRMRPNRVLDHLRGVLASGHYAPGAKFYSNNTLAKRFGISPPTAGKVLDSLCSDGLVERVKGSGTYVTEHAMNHRIEQYAMVSWMEIGHPALRGSERYQLLISFEEVCNQDGCNAQVINVDDPEFEPRFQSLIEKGLDGILFLPPFDHPSVAQIIEQTRAMDIPVIYWSDGEVLPELDHAYRTRFDSSQCGRIATEHLLSMGHKHIAAIRRSSFGQWSLERIDGYHQAMAEARIPKSQRQVVHIPDDCLSPSQLTELLRQIKNDGCTAIVASNDALAYELILAGRAIGLQFPKDLSIIGVDNRGPAILLGLTTIELPAMDMAGAITRIFQNHEQYDQQTPVTVGCRLISRNTVGPPANVNVS